jgi:hypothetical protein
MRNNLDEVHDDPRRAVVCVRAEWMLAARLSEILKFLRSCAHLPLAGTGADDDVIGNLAAPADVEQHNICAFRVRKRASHIDRELARRLRV